MNHIKLLFFFLIGPILLNSQGQNQFKKINSDWVKAFNQDTSKQVLAQFYLENGGLYIEDKMIFTSVKIASVLAELKQVTGNIISFESHGIHKQSEDQFFELGQYTTNEVGITLAAVIGWNRKSGSWKKELEIIYREDILDDFDEEGIDRARELWVEISNDHDHEKLVNEVYTEGAVYFHGGKVSEGREEITPRYAYMSRPNWSITLTSLQQLPVKNSLVMEVGQYRSGGVGHYVLIWKQTGETWQAQFDFNF